VLRSRPSGSFYRRRPVVVSTHTVVQLNLVHALGVIITGYTNHPNGE
jgi:hypothetical protein